MHRFLLSIALCLYLGACSQNQDVAARIDADWFKTNLEQAHLSHWLRVLPTGNGFFNTAVNRHWQPVDPQPGDLVGQARAIYTLAIAHELTGNPEYRRLVTLGTDFMLQSFRDQVHGGWYEAVTPDGKLKVGNKRLYSQAFAMLALSQAYAETKDSRYLDAALQTWRVIEDHFADSSGGYRAGMNEDFSQVMLDNSQNPPMHVYEALLSLYQTSGSAEARDAANRIGNFVARKLLQGLPDGSARIPEVYDSAWNPLDHANGGHIDIGHQFEWAYLLSAGAEAGLNPVFAGVGERLLNFALANGYDSVDSGVFSTITPDSKVNRQKGSWQQAEALRALMHYAVIRGRSDLWGRVTQMTEFIRSEFLDPEDGGWFTGPASECHRGRCADNQPDAYHIAALHREAIHLTKPSGHIANTIGKER